MGEEIIDEEVLELTKKGTLRKRKPKKSNTYFTQDTETAILQYRKEAKQSAKDKIYREKIHYAFYKLSENIIHSFKFYYIDTNSIEDLKYEVISFLLQKINLYDQSKGKAYSYFGTIAKRYLIAYNKKNYKKLLSKVDFTEIHNDNKTIDSLIEDKATLYVDKDVIFDKFIKDMDLKILDIFISESELKIAACLLELFKKVNSLDTINKKLIFLYIKEMTGENTNSITKVIKVMKSHYKEALLNEMEKINSMDIYN
jgi:nitrate reductase NapAB chaperone NapD